MGYTSLIVVNGDDAGWIDSGTDAMGFCVRQLNDSHLARFCRRDWNQGKEKSDSDPMPTTLKQQHSRHFCTLQNTEDVINLMTLTY